MRGRWISAALALALSAGLAAADQTKSDKSDKSDKGDKKTAKNDRSDRGTAAAPKPTYGMGRVDKVDTEKGVVTLMVLGPNGPRSQEIKADKGLKFVTMSGGRRKEYTGKEMLKELKPGTMVRVAAGTGGEGHVIESLAAMPTGYGGPPASMRRGASVPGKILKVDADKGTLTATLKEGDEEKEKEFKVSDKVRFMLMEKGAPKMLQGKEGLKDKGLKKGKEARFYQDPDGNLMAVIAIPPTETGGPAAPGGPGARGPAFGGPPPTRGVGLRTTGLAGTVRKVDADKGVLVVRVTGQDKDQEFKVGKETRVLIMGGRIPKQYTGKEGLKADGLRKGSQVRLVESSDGKLQAVFATPTGGDDGEKKPEKEGAKPEKRGTKPEKGERKDIK